MTPATYEQFNEEMQRILRRNSKAQIKVELSHQALAEMIKCAVGFGVELTAEQFRKYDHLPMLMKKKQAAEVFSVSESHLETLKKNGALRIERDGASVRFHKADLIEYFMNVPQKSRLKKRA